MSIPAKVILGGDLDTVGRLRSGRLDDPFMPTLPRPYGEGLLLVIPPHKSIGEVTYEVPFTCELHRVHFKTNKEYVQDVWEMYLNDDKPSNFIVETNYQKNYTEGLTLMSIVKLKKGDKLTFRLTNRDSSTGVRAEISMAFLKEDSDGNGKKSPYDEQVGVYLSKNIYGSEAGNPIASTSLYDESIPFKVKFGRDYYRIITHTGLYRDISSDFLSVAQNTTKVVTMKYTVGGQVKSVQLKKHWIYVAVPSDITGSVAIREYLDKIEELFKDYSYYENIPFQVRGIPEEGFKNILEIKIS